MELMAASRIFLLSPARCGGKRSELLFNDGAQFDLARRLRETGAPLGEVFSFLSGLYFRGKRAYAHTFGRSPQGLAGAYAITSNRGLLPIETLVTLNDLRAFGGVDIESGDIRYREPLVRSARELLSQARDSEIVLLGSVASGKYVDVLVEVFGSWLTFPAEFIGRGDMSRGGLMLRHVEENRELTYIPVVGAERRGTRPPKLQRRPGSSQASRDRATHTPPTI